MLESVNHRKDNILIIINEDDEEEFELTFDEFIAQKTIVVFLLSILSVGICCLLSQCLVRFSKGYKVHLNKYYSKKRYEKAKMIQQYLNQEEQAAINKQKKKQDEADNEVSNS